MLDYGIKMESTLHLVLRLRGGCFIGSTKISMADGTTARIDSLAADDQIVTYDVLKRKFISTAVDQVFERQSTELTTIRTSTTSFTCTPGHPFWAPEKGWVAVDPTNSEKNHQVTALQLMVGDSLLSCEGKPDPVVSIARHTSPVPVKVYNLHVPETNTYVVNGAVAHNGSDDQKEMGVSAGGKIKQKIYRDTTDLRFYDTENAQRIFVNIANNWMWKAVTGKDMPRTPVSAQTYTMCGMPWFDLYDEPKVDVKPADELLKTKNVLEIEQAQEEETGVLPNTEDAQPVEVPTNQIVNLQIEDGDW